MKNIFLVCVLTCAFFQFEFIHSLDVTHFTDLIDGKESSIVGEKSIISNIIIDEILNIYALVSDSVDNELCRNHSQLFRDAVKSNKLWALKMLDSSSKIHDGLLAGNIVDMGNYDECLQLEDVPSEFGPFSGQHCMVSLDPGGSKTKQKALPNIIAPNGRQLPGFLTRGYRRDTKGSGVNVFVSLGGKWSICIPSSCRPVDLKHHLESALHSFLGNMSLKVNEKSCHTRADQTVFTASDWFAVGFMAFFGVLVLLSTSYDLLYSNAASRRNVFLAFSVYTNGRKLLKIGQPNADSLSAVHGVRFISMCWVVLGHRYFFTLITPAVNAFVIVDYLSDWNHIFVTNATVSVDSFFLLSGLLVCYIFLKEMDKGRRFNVPLYYIHRYIRLTPAFAVMMLLTATLFYHLDDGPLWHVNSDIARKSCEDNWWVGMVYLNNYINVNSICMGQTWYLSVDMQLFWLSPLILYPLWRWPKYGKILLGLLVASGLLIAFLVAYINEFSVNALSGAGDSGKMQYFPTHTRFTPWLIGVGLGYLLHHTKQTNLRLSPFVVTVGWILSLGLLATTWLLAHRFLQPKHAYERIFESFYTCLMRPGWALGLAWVIFACVRGYGGFVNTFLSWDIFQILGRFTYTVYLTHFAVLSWISGSTKTPQYVSDRIIVTQFFGDMIISFSCAFVLSVIFESPAIVIERYLMGNRDRPENIDKKNDAENISEERVDEKSPNKIGENISIRSNGTGIDNDGFKSDDEATSSIANLT